MNVLRPAFKGETGHLCFNLQQQWLLANLAWLSLKIAILDFLLLLFVTPVVSEIISATNELQFTHYLIITSC